MRVLALSSNYEPIGTIDWKKAVGLVFLDKVTVLDQYSDVIKSINFSMNIPSVIVFKHGKYAKIKSVRFSRKNIWLRDEGCCQYCHKEVEIKGFTIDHVIPKSKGGKSVWDNVVVSCYNCNQKKGEKSLAECSYKLHKFPRKPASLPYIDEIVGFFEENYIHESWKFWLQRKCV